jgi:hypothetical protein
MANDTKYTQYFHAEAHALGGNLLLPFKAEIKKQAFVKLAGESDDLLLEGPNQDSAGWRAQPNYLSQHAKNFRLEGIVSYSAANTQVSGHRSRKHKDAFVTLATAMVEDFNVLNVVTADRMVAQIATTHFPDQYAPEISFLGTHFENLRIARHRCEPLLQLGLAGERPEGKDALYLGKGTKLMQAIEGRYAKLKTDLAGLGAEIQKSLLPKNPDKTRVNPNHSLVQQYHEFDIAKFGDIQTQAKDARTAKSQWKGITCSLVEHVEIKDISMKGSGGTDVHIPPPARSFGHIIHIPGFGTIFLAELTVNHNSFKLTMIRLELGCSLEGNISAGETIVNGGGSGGH